MGLGGAGHPAGGDVSRSAEERAPQGKVHRSAAAAERALALGALAAGVMSALTAQFFAWLSFGGLFAIVLFV